MAVKHLLDELLIVVSQRMKEALREGDTLSSIVVGQAGPSLCENY